MDKIYDLIVIGGGPAGLSAGIYAGRAQMDVLIIEKSEVGGQITTTSEVVNYPGIKEISGHHLGEQMREQALGFGVEFLKSEVTNESIKGKWSVFFFYPADFTFVCPTELGDLA
ncbi:MAG: FAD-dependent oxidoreductase, partial [Cetobacterium sp.]